MKKVFIIGALLIFAGMFSFMAVKSNQAVGKCDFDQIERAGCCSRHGGVCGCNKQLHRQKCCDGAISPSCGC